MKVIIGHGGNSLEEGNEISEKIYKISVEKNISTLRIVNEFHPTNRFGEIEYEADKFSFPFSKGRRLAGILNKVNFKFFDFEE